MSKPEKDEARDSRLSIRKNNKEVLKKEFHAKALDICKPEVKKFAECAKREGFFVVFKCRGELRESKYRHEFIYRFSYHPFLIKEITCT